MGARVFSGISYENGYQNEHLMDLTERGRPNVTFSKVFKEIDAIQDHILKLFERRAVMDVINAEISTAFSYSCRIASSLSHNFQFPHKIFP